VQRLPQGGNLPLFNELYSAQPVQIQTVSGKWINGSAAGLSVHLLPGRHNPPNLDDIDNMYIDVGAKSAAEVRSSGADALNPVVLEHHLLQFGFGSITGVGIGDKFGDAALIELLRQLDPSKVKGTLTVAFVAQQWTGARGLERLLESVKPDELLYVGRMMPAPGAPRFAANAGNAEAQRPSHAPGSGVLIAESDSNNPLATELKQLAQQSNVSLTQDFSAPLLPRSYTAPPSLPERTVHVAIATTMPSTPAETINAQDLSQLVSLLGSYLQGQAVGVEYPDTAMLPNPAPPARPAAAPSPEAILKSLIETYGVSGGHEEPVRQTVERLLPAWAKPQTDAAGNLTLHWGTGQKSRVLVVAHMDEIGYEVHSIRPDGTLELANKGGGISAFFMGHPMLIHTKTGIRGGVLELPDGWEKPGFQWPRGIEAPAILDAGAHNAEEVAKLGIEMGDWVTIPKEYRNLLGRRASGRSMDDRVGCAALVAAAWALGPNLGNRDVTFVWSTGEELGLVGATEVAKRLASEGHSPDFVFAVDTFVSSDSPLELPRFAHALLGDGFVVRAVDNSNVVPTVDVQKVLSIAKRSSIPAQYGVTGGGNDGSAFVRYGSTDVALGWPLRYSHSPGEVIDTGDLDALAKIVAAAAKEW
jgi:putative aminopeptidase FrvX